MDRAHECGFSGHGEPRCYDAVFCADVSNLSMPFTLHYAKPSQHSLGDTATSTPTPALGRIAADLIELQLLDYICGQCDRHPGNYFSRRIPVSDRPNIFGIDLDLSFGMQR